MEWNVENWWEIWDVWIVEVNVYVFLTGMKSSVGDVEDEMIWIWSDDGGVSNWHGLDVVDGSAGVERARSLGFRFGCRRCR